MAVSDLTTISGSTLESGSVMAVSDLTTIFQNDS